MNSTGTDNLSEKHPNNITRIKLTFDLYPGNIKTMNSTICTAFDGHKKIAHGSILEVALRVKAHLDRHDASSVLVFDDSTARAVDLDLRGSVRSIEQRYRVEVSGEADAETKPGPGRPKLGVIAKEVTLLPRHWEWLASQPGGASVTLRKLVEEAKTKNQRKDRVRQAQEATHRFMTALAGDLPGYEEALRVFYAKKYDAFEKLIHAWPRDVREHIRKLASPAVDA